MTAKTSSAHLPLLPAPALQSTTGRARRPTVDIEQVRMCRAQVERLFRALDAKDEKAILAAYADECKIDHPLIGRMSKNEFGKAIAIFIRDAPDFELGFDVCNAGAGWVKVEWTIKHTFHLTGRPIIQAGMSIFFVSGRGITRQIDRFDRRAWSRQALGVKGLILSYVPGWRSFVRQELRRAVGIVTQ